MTRYGFCERCGKEGEIRKVTIEGESADACPDCRKEIRGELNNWSWLDRRADELARRKAEGE